MVEMDQMQFIFQNSLPAVNQCCSGWIPLGTEALILILEKVLNCRYYLIIDTASQPSVFSC